MPSEEEWKKQFREDFLKKRFYGLTDQDIEEQACEYFIQFIENLLKKGE